MVLRDYKSDGLSSELVSPVEKAVCDQDARLAGQRHTVLGACSRTWDEGRNSTAGRSQRLPSRPADIQTGDGGQAQSSASAGE